MWEDGEFGCGALSKSRRSKPASQQALVFEVRIGEIIERATEEEGVGSSLYVFPINNSTAFAVQILGSP